MKTEKAAPRRSSVAPRNQVVENGPVRVAVEVTRETAGSRFVQTIRLSAGDPGKRVEFENVIDWNTRESNLKATFPLTASNEMATYNWDIGTIQRPTAEPKKFEVPSHQWIDLTDISGKFGATVLTDCKNGSDKPNDHTLRLTLIRTPGVKGGYPDQATQDLGHHEFVYGIAAHADGWRDAQTDWQAQRMNAPLIAFETSKHEGALGKSFSLLMVNNPRIRVLAVKKAERSDEVVVRLVELDATPQSGGDISFATQIPASREVNGQGTASWASHLELWCAGYVVQRMQRAFALRLAVDGKGSRRAKEPSSGRMMSRWRVTMASIPIRGSMGRAMRYRRRCFRRRSRSTVPASNSRRPRPAFPTPSSQRARRSIWRPGISIAFTYWRPLLMAIRRRRLRWVESRWNSTYRTGADLSVNGMIGSGRGQISMSIMRSTVR